VASQRATTFGPVPAALVKKIVKLRVKENEVRQKN
jgi:hypothetical protein